MLLLLCNWFSGVIRDRAADFMHHARRHRGRQTIRLRRHGIKFGPHLLRVHYDEPGICRPIRAAGQFESVVPDGGDDGAGLRPHFRHQFVFLRLFGRRQFGRQNRHHVQALFGTVVVAG